MLGCIQWHFPDVSFTFAASLLLPAPPSSLLWLFADEKALRSPDCSPWVLICSCSGGCSEEQTRVWVRCRDLRVKRCPSALCLNLRALGLAQRCHISDPRHAGEACVGSSMGCSALGCPQGKGEAKHNVRTELRSKPAVSRMQIPPWGLPASTSSYKKGKLGKSSPFCPEPFLASKRRFGPMQSHFQRSQACAWDLLGCAG